MIHSLNITTLKYAIFNLTIGSCEPACTNAGNGNLYLRGQIWPCATFRNEILFENYNVYLFTMCQWLFSARTMWDSYSRDQTTHKASSVIYYVSLHTHTKRLNLWLKDLMKTQIHWSLTEWVSLWKVSPYFGNNIC
jgi:hypothetical protein